MRTETFSPRRATILATLCALAILATTGCLGAGKERAVEESPSRPISDVLAEHAPRLMEIEGVTAVGEGALANGTPCIRVFLLRSDPQLERRIPRAIEGHPVDVRVTGEIRALPDSR